MDSLTQAGLGAAVGFAVMGRQAGRKSLVWGAVIATVPDLDVFIPLGDDVANFTQHRSATHSLIIHSLVAPAIAWALGCHWPASRPYRLRRWLLAYLCLVTHALLDGLTVYGTQLFWPLPLTPTTWSALFIIDPAYTILLLVGITGALWVAPSRRSRWNHAGLALSSGYILLSVAAKLHVDGIAKASLEESAPGSHFISMATPFNTLLWRVVAIDEERYYEGYYSILDRNRRISFTPYANNHTLLDDIASEETVRRLRWFSKGFYGVKRQGAVLNVFDLRMGFEPAYVFGFAVAEIRDGNTVSIASRRLDGGPDIMTMGWVWRRIWDESLAPPHL